jgi:hypothetical protein
MEDLQVKTFFNGDGYTVTGNTKVGDDLVRNNPDDGIMRATATPSGHLSFVGNSDSLIIDDRDGANLSINASVAAQNKPVGI